jgi:hypothetical protein
MQELLFLFENGDGEIRAIPLMIYEGLVSNVDSLILYALRYRYCWSRNYAGNNTNNSLLRRSTSNKGVILSYYLE